MLLFPLLAQGLKFPVQIRDQCVRVQAHLLGVGAHVALQKQFTVDLAVVAGFNGLNHGWPKMLGVGDRGDTESQPFSRPLQLLTNGFFLA